MADSGHFGLAESGVLVAAADGHRELSERIRAELAALLADLDADAAAMSGEQLVRFRQARERFAESFAALAAVCGAHGAELADIDAAGRAADARVADDHHAVTVTLRDINGPR